MNETATTTRDPAQVRRMFGSIAWRYDLTNHLLSCGVDFYWRRRAAEIVKGWRPKKVVDLATGTGDLALAIQTQLPQTEVIGADFTEEMLAIARRKGVRQTVVADAMKLPFEDGAFDCATIAFGLRNLSDWGAALREMRRVLKTNGHLLVLEFSLPQMPMLRAIYRVYLHRCMPAIGSFLTKEKSAYDYLGTSIEQFPSGDTMCRLMESNGFSNASAKPLTGGIVTIYTAPCNGGL